MPKICSSEALTKNTLKKTISGFATATVERCDKRRRAAHISDNYSVVVPQNRLNLFF